MSDTPPGEPPVTLVVCRANLGRSPLVAHLLRTEAERRGIAADVRSGGLLVEPGNRQVTGLAQLVAPWGLDLSQHRARAVELDSQPPPQLVITFEAALKRLITQREPALVQRVFTQREILRLVGSPEWDRGWEGRPDLVARLNRMRPLVDAGDDDTVDPASIRRRWRLRRFVAQLADDTGRTAEVLWGSR